MDETGQDVRSNVFIVAVIVTEKEKDQLIKLCREFENESGKGKNKWHKSKYDQKIVYIRKVFSQPVFQNVARYHISKNVKDYDLATIMSIAKAVNWHKPEEKFTTSIYIDALSKTKRYKYGKELRSLGIRTSKVQGIAREESSVLMRLADAVAGFVRDVIEDKTIEFQKIYQKGKRQKILVEV